MQSSPSVQFFSASANAQECTTILEDPIAIKISKTDNPYEILNISENAPAETILQAYKSLALQYHPDHHQNNAESQQFSMQIMQKLNKAREHFFPQLSRYKATTSQASLNDHKFFIEKLIDTIFWEALGLNTKNIKLLHVPQKYCMAMVLNWIDQTIKQNQPPFLEKLKVALANTASIDKMLAFTQEINLYISEQMESEARTRTLDRILTRVHASQDYAIVSTVNLAWNYSFPEFISQVVDCASKAQNTPFLIHNIANTDESKMLYFEKLAKIDTEEKFIGILYKDEKFYLFSPYHLLIDEKNELQALNQDELTQHLFSHYYSFPQMITASVAELKIPMAIVSFEVKANDLIKTETALTILQQQLVNYVLQYNTPDSIVSARQFLQSIADCHNQDLLSEVYSKVPEFFPLPLLCEFLDVAIARKNLALALAICQLSPPELSQNLSTYYINHYLTDVKDYSDLISTLESFKTIQIDLTSLISAEVKAQSPQNISSLTDDIKLLHYWFKLGLSISEQQREELVRQLSAAISKETNRLKYRRDFIGLNIPDFKNRIDTATQDAVEKMELLIANGYSLYVNSNFIKDEHPFFALLDADRNELVRSYCEKGYINLDAKDQDGRTILNYMTKDKNWNMAAWLCKLNAPYATGPEIPYTEIPSLVAWLEEIEQLRPWYLSTQPELLQTLTTKGGDPLSKALVAGKIRQVKFLLDNGYLEKLKQNPLLYIYSAAEYDFNMLKLLLENISLKDNFDLDATQFKEPAIYHPENLLQEIALTGNTGKEEIILIGACRAEIDNIVAKLPFANLTKISTPDCNTIFYSANSELTEVLSIFFHKTLLEQQIAAIEESLMQTPSGKIPDLSYIMNSLINLAEFIHKTLAVLDLDHIKEKSFRHKAKDFPRQKYINSLTCLKGKDLPVGLQINFSKDQKVSDFQFIPDISSVYTFDISFNHNDLIANRNNYEMLSDEIFLTLCTLQKLRIVFTDIFDLKFTPLKPYPYRLFDNGIDDYIMEFRKEWAKYKDELDAIPCACLVM